MIFAQVGSAVGVFLLLQPIADSTSTVGAVQSENLIQSALVVIQPFAKLFVSTLINLVSMGGL